MSPRTQFFLAAVAAAGKTVAISAMEVVEARGASERVRFSGRVPPAVVEQTLEVFRAATLAAAQARILAEAEKATATTVAPPPAPPTES